MFSVLRPFLFSLDPETAHDLAVKSLKFNPLPSKMFEVEDEQMLNIELLEASDIDGANWSQKIFSIVIPLLWPTTILNMILNLIGGFRAFDIVYVLTRGGPAHYSEVLASYLYYYSFSASSLRPL